MSEKRYLDYDGLQELVLKIKEYIGDAGKLEFKGTVADVAHLPALNTQKVGWMWTVTAEGKTTSDFVEGPNLRIAPNSEVAAIKVSGTSTKSIYSVNDGTTYVDADLGAYTPTGTVGAGTKVCEVYIATDADTDLEEGHWYVTDDGAAFYDATVLADDFADITKTAVSNEDAITALGAKYTGSAFADLNTYTESTSEDTMKWSLLGPVFDVSGKLSFTTDEMPSAGEDGEILLYLGETTFVYNPVIDPAEDSNPAALGWYELDGSDYVLTADTELATGKTYYTKDEEFVQGVIYQYDESESAWIGLNSGDQFTPITNSEIDALFA